MSEQRFEKGRDTVAAPTEKVHRSIVNDSTDLGRSGLVFNDGRIWLDWTHPYGDPALVDTVQSVYIAYYGRPADAGGLDYWTARLTAEGGDLTAIIDAFFHSEEAQERFGGLSDEEMLTRIYQQLFGHEPDPEGRAFYLEALRNGDTSLARIALDILKGARNRDALLIANKTKLANHFTEQTVAYKRQYGKAAFADVGAVLALVSTDPESLKVAMTAADALVQGLPAG